MHATVFVLAVTTTKYVYALDHKTLIDKRRTTLVTSVYANNSEQSTIVQHCTHAKHCGVACQCQSACVMRGVSGRDLLRAHSTRLREQTHVTIDAIRSIRFDHISMSAQLLIAFETAEMMQMPIVLFGACVFARKYQLQYTCMLYTYAQCAHLIATIASQKSC